MTGAINDPVHRARLGALRLTVVSDGPLVLGPIEASFAGVPLPDLHRSMERWGCAPDPLVFQQNALVVEDGRETVLFDTGMGASTLFGTTTGRLLGGLAAAGIAPEQLTAICLTHAHADHAWGLVGPDGRPVFPNARVVLNAGTLADWTEMAEGQLDGVPPGYAETARAQLEGVRDRLQVIGEDGQAVPGVTTIATPGHTMGHVSFEVRSGDSSLLVIGDVVHHPALHLDHPRIEFLYDSDRALAVATRLAWLERLVETRMPVQSYHFPFPGLGRITREGGRYGWEPIAGDL